MLNGVACEVNVGGESSGGVVEAPLVGCIG